MTEVALPPFQALLDEHGSDVLGFLVASVGPDDAEDCFQEALIAALRAYPTLRHGRNLRAWLLTIAHRKAIDHHRSRARRAHPGGAAEEVERAGHRPDGLPPSTIEPPEQAALNAEASGELWRAVSALPPKQRSSVALRFATGMTHREIGETIDTSEDAARRNVHEGLRTLREELT